MFSCKSMYSTVKPSIVDVNMRILHSFGTLPTQAITGKDHYDRIGPPLL